MEHFFVQFALGLWGITPGNYSSIAPIQDNLYAVVDDKDKVEGFKLLTLDIDPESGQPIFAEMLQPTGMEERRFAGAINVRDCEGACYIPSTQTVFVSGEADQKIKEYDLEGNLTGRELRVPEMMDKEHIASNYGFEALTYNAVQHRFWTTTESMLPADGSPLHAVGAPKEESLHALNIKSKKKQKAAKKKASQLPLMQQDGHAFAIVQQESIDYQEAVDSLAILRREAQEAKAKAQAANPKIAFPEFRNRVRLLSFDDKLRPAASYIYELDAPLATGRKGNGAHGIPSIFALDNGKLIVMEREGFAPQWKFGAYTNIKIFIVDINQEQPVPLSTPMADVPEQFYVKKQLLYEFKTKLTLFDHSLANYEGICLGPRLNDGGQTLLLIADSQNRMGNFMYHLKDYIGIIYLNPNDHSLE